MTAAFEHFLKESLSKTQVEGCYRQLYDTESDGVTVVQNGKRYLSFCSNDYLGIAADISCPTTMQGAAASRLITGNHQAYKRLETMLAEMKQSDAALVFGSGYLANIGVITALMGRGDAILYDKYSHACMIDGAQLSGAMCHRFRHNEVGHLETLLQRYRRQAKHCLIMTETVFSMDGDRAPLAGIHQLTKEYDAWLMTDDAHGLGLPHESANPAEIQVGTLSKAAGGYGGYVCGSRYLIDYLINHARSLIFSTALPQALIEYSCEALRVIESEPQRGRKVMQYAEYLCDTLGLPVPESPIIPIILGANENVLLAQQKLKEQDILVSAIRPPTVPKGTARLRISLSAAHSDTNIQQLVDALRLVLPSVKDYSHLT